MKILFSKYPSGTWPDSTIQHSDWHVQPSGNQKVRIVNGALELDTEKVGVGSDFTTFASLVTSVPGFANWKKLVVEYKTVAQHRIPAHQHWEVAWVLFNFENVNRFYSVILKPDGWEVAKEWFDGNGMQRQDFLGYSFDKGFPINHRYRVEITQVENGDSLEFTLAYRDLTLGTPLTVLGTVIDDGTRESGPAYKNGSVGLYTEDSRGLYYSVSIT